MTWKCVSSLALEVVLQWNKESNTKWIGRFRVSRTAQAAIAVLREAHMCSTLSLFSLPKYRKSVKFSLVEHWLFLPIEGRTSQEHQTVRLKCWSATSKQERERGGGGGYVKILFCLKHLPQIYLHVTCLSCLYFFCLTEQLQWRCDREEKDRAKKRFFEDLNHFPNLFSLSALFHDMDHMQALLRRKEEELQDGYLEYQLEVVRCNNLIIFLQYLLGRKQKALDYCQGLWEDNSKSIIFLTLKAMLEYELRPPKEHKKTLATLQDLYRESDFYYLQAVAEAEKGYVLISIGPIGFLKAMDLLQKAINSCPGSDIFLWKYDLALAIRRNFNVGAYSEHPELAAQVLAQKAIELLRDTAKVCPNNSYRVRSKVELARLISHLTFFCSVCTEDEKVAILELIEDYNEGDLFEEAFKMVHSKDFYTIRECGRYFLRIDKFSMAMQCFHASYSERKTSMACQLFGKAYLKMYKSGFDLPAFPRCMDFEGQSELPSTSQEPTADSPQAVKSSMVRFSEFFFSYV